MIEDVDNNTPGMLSVCMYIFITYATLFVVSLALTLPVSLLLWLLRRGQEVFCVIA